MTDWSDITALLELVFRPRREKYPDMVKHKSSCSDTVTCKRLISFAFQKIRFQPSAVCGEQQAVDRVSLVCYTSCVIRVVIKQFHKTGPITMYD